MLKFRSIKKLAFFIKILKYQRIRFLNKHSCIWSLCSHITLTVYKLYKRKIIFTTYTAVILTKCRCDMNNTCTITHSYIVIGCNIMSFLFLSCSFSSCALKQWLICFVFQILTNILLKNLVCRGLLRAKFTKNFVKQSFCHIVCVSICCFYLAINLCRVYTECNVRWQGPRCCSPCQEICIFSNNLKTNDRRTFLDRFISL